MCKLSNCNNKKSQIKIYNWLFQSVFASGLIWPYSLTLQSYNFWVRVLYSHKRKKPKKKTPNQNAISNKYSVLIGRWWGTSYKLILASVIPVRPSLLFLVLDSLSRRRIGLFIIEDLLVTVQERTTGDLSRCWLSYVGLLVYCPHKLRLFDYFERTW